MTPFMHHGGRPLRLQWRARNAVWRPHALADNWLHHVNDVSDKHADAFAAIGLPSARVDRLCGLNVIEQVANICQTTIVRDAWERGQNLAAYGHVWLGLWVAGWIVA